MRRILLPVLLIGMAVSPLALGILIVVFTQSRPPTAMAQASSPPASLSPERRGIGLRVYSTLDPRMLSDIDERRSLVVTDQVILRGFTFARVMETLVRQGGEPGLTPHVLFRRWWSSQVMGPRFGFPYDPRPLAARMAVDDDPFSDRSSGSGYIPIGLFNRIDLAPEDGADCGEYRIVFARKSGRLLINFEGLLPNPHPEDKLAGCRLVAEFWSHLSLIKDPAQRAVQLLGFYFNGLPGFSPVVHVDNYGARCPRSDDPACRTGQIRTNERLQEPWMLREFRVARVAGPRLTVLPATIKQSPFARLFCCASREVTPSVLDAFRRSVAASVKSLISESGLLDFHHEIDPRFDTGQGIPRAEDESDINRSFATPGASHNALVGTIQRELTALGSTLIPQVVVGRIQALSCAGCHRLSSQAQNRKNQRTDPDTECRRRSLPSCRAARKHCATCWDPRASARDRGTAGGPRGPPVDQGPPAA
jgi:hypothetical protein